MNHKLYIDKHVYKCNNHVRCNIQSTAKKVDEKQIHPIYQSNNLSIKENDYEQQAQPLL